jgi:hypothetical protein
MMQRLLVLVLLALALTGCGESTEPTVAGKPHPIGEKFDHGAFSWIVSETEWKTQLGDGFSARLPKGRFLLVNVAATNTTRQETSLPPLTLIGSNGQEFQEVTDTNGVENAMGLLRLAAPTQTIQGRIVFDVPLGSYKLQLADGSDTGYDKHQTVDLPLRLDAPAVGDPLPGAGLPGMPDPIKSDPLKTK